MSQLWTGVRGSLLSMCQSHELVVRSYGFHLQPTPTCLGLKALLLLLSLWFIMGGQPTLYRKTCNIFNLLALLLFFKMILFSRGRLVRLSCSPLVYFESVRSGRLVLLYYMFKLSSAKCHHFRSSHILSSRPHYINAHNKLQHAWHLLEELQRQHKGV